MIDVEQIGKNFNGKRALNGFTLHVDSGELFGLVGPNGAGKTTLMKVLSTLLPPDCGSARIDGIEVTADPRAVKHVIGYMPDQFGVYQDMTVREFLDFFADAFHLKGSRHQMAVDRALEQSGLEHRDQEVVEHLSFGLKQRLALAKTLMHDPKVLLLDEPATGLDPIARIELRERLRQLQAQGMTILVSSHILSDLENICTQIALINEGRNGTDAEGKSVIQLRAAQAPVRIYDVEVMGDVAPAVGIITSQEGVRLCESKGQSLAVEISGADKQAAAFLRALVLGGVNVIRFDRCTVNLEQRYRLAFREKRP
jgi:ABC-2 type transport system ATP-binding protein